MPPLHYFMTIAFCQQWEESERGWGVRPDGFSLHATFDACEAYIDSYWATMPPAIPDEYSRPCGKPYKVQVSDELFEKIVQKKGIRVFGWYYPRVNGAVNETKIYPVQTQ